MTNLLKKKSFCWNEDAETTFITLKKAMVNTPVLALPNFTLPFVVETDACATGIGAVLMQQGHPVAYLSKALGPQNQCLSIYEKEFLVVIIVVDKWRSYLQRGSFLILTDHKSLCTLEEQPLGTKLQRKAMAKLVGLQFRFQYKKGTDNGAANALSRVSHLLQIHTISSCRPDWVQEIFNSYEMDLEVQQLLTSLAVFSPNSHGYTLEHG